jgi:hypothetical protein
MWQQTDRETRVSSPEQIDHIAGSWFPDLVGTNQVRRFKLDGDRLILHADTPWGSVEIIWRR